MSRSLKKGPYINVKLERSYQPSEPRQRLVLDVIQCCELPVSYTHLMNESGKKVVVKTWARASMISPDFVGPFDNPKVTSGWRCDEAGSEQFFAFTTKYSQQIADQTQPRTCLLYTSTFIMDRDSTI